MREIAKKCEVKKFSADIVEDFCNLASGGGFVPPSEYRQEVARRASDCLPPPEEGNWRLSNGQKTNSRQKAVASATDRGMKYQERVQDFLRTIEPDKFPGSSPLEQAMNCLKLLSEQKGGSGGGEEGEILPIFIDERPENVAEKMNDLMDQVESLDDAEKELLDPDQDAGAGKHENGDDGLQKMKLAADMSHGKDVWLKVSRQLDRMVRMRVAKSVKVIPDTNGDEVRNRPIKDFGEMGRLVKSEWALPEVYRTFRIVTHAAQVRERVRREEKKQLLYMIIDCSGSMSNGQRIGKAGGVLMNRLKAVVEGEAEIFIRFFDSKLYEEHHAGTAKEAKDLIHQFTEKNFSGGSTNISGCAMEAQKRIEEIAKEKNLARPELVVVSDGEDNISLTTESLHGTKLHAFVVERSNTALTELAIKTGGVGINNL